MVAHIASARYLLSITIVLCWDHFQIDAKNAFLIGDLIEEFYMQALLGYDHPPNKVCRLHTALYGLYVSFSSSLELRTFFKADWVSDLIAIPRQDIASFSVTFSSLDEIRSSL